MSTTASSQLPPSTAELASAQGGGISRLQLLGLGWTDHAITAQVAAQRWQVAVPGVLVLFTGPLPRRTRQWVAVLHCGEGAVLSHETAAEVYGLRQVDPGEPVHVLAPHARKVAAAPWIRVHRTRLPQPERARQMAGLPPVTCIEDTVLDLVDQSRRRGAAVGLILDACRLRLTSPERLRAAMGKRRRVRYRQLVKALCADYREGVTSSLEHKYRKDVEKAHGLPVGTRQQRARSGTRQVYRDVDYLGFATLVELDGRRGHEGAAASFRDRNRDNAAVVSGRTTLRFGWMDVVTAPCSCAAQVAAVLARNGWTGELQACGPACSAAPWVA